MIGNNKDLTELMEILLDSGEIRVFRSPVCFFFLHSAVIHLNVLCEDLPAVRQFHAEPRAHRAARLPARPRLLRLRARAGDAEHRGIHAGARGSARGVAALGLPRPPGCGPAGGARRPAGADAGS